MFYAAIAAGIAFIGIGAASAIYSNVALDVALDNKVSPGSPDIITPNMDVGNTATISVKGSTFNIKIEEPDRHVITSKSNVTSFSYNLTAQKSGQYRIEIMNNGSTDLTVTGHTLTKSSPLALSGALMLLVTGVIIIGLGLRFKKT